MNIIDISNWTINEINNSINTFKDTSLTDIGMVNCDIDSINIVGKVTTATLWINEDVGTDGYTGAAPLKIYKEDKIEIKLNSPLLEGDSIEIVDGKLCHVHRYEKIVLNGSENWLYWSTNTFILGKYNANAGINKNVISDSLPTTIYGNYQYGVSCGNGYIAINNGLSQIDINDFKQWLQANPVTVVYELAEPYYEEITPHQSSIILKTFNESSMIINTNLPIETKLSYRTNVPSISTLSNRVVEVSESDNIIQNLIDIIDDEVDE